MKNILFTALFILISIGLFSQTKILAPELVSPENEADLQMPDALLDWNAVAGIGMISYEVQLDTDSLFSDPVIENFNTTSYKTNNLLFGVEYFWRVRATDDNGTGDWADTFSFIVFDEVLLNKPGNEDDEQDLAVELKWRNKAGGGNGEIITGITHYEYEVAYDTTFEQMYESGSINYDEFPANSSFFTKTITELLFDTVYLWRVRAVHDLDETEWSNSTDEENPWSFRTINIVELKDPENESEDNGAEVEINWDGYDGLSGYMYQLCDDPDFQDGCTIYNCIEDDTVVNELLFGHTYYWRIKMYHAVDTSEWSEVWQFETINTVYLESPETGESVNNMPLLEWEEIDGVSGYEIQYDTDEDFSNAISIIETDNSHQIVNSLDDGQTYYWRVQGYHDLSMTEWSDTWSFLVESQGIDELFTSENVNVYPNPAYGELNIEITTDLFTPVEISLLDLLGQPVKKGKYKIDNKNNKVSFNLSDIGSGLYIIRIKSGDSIYSQKIVVDM